MASNAAQGYKNLHVKSFASADMILKVILGHYGAVSVARLHRFRDNITFHSM